MYYLGIWNQTRTRYLQKLNIKWLAKKTTKKNTWSGHPYHYLWCCLKSASKQTRTTCVWKFVGQWILRNSNWATGFVTAVKYMLVVCVKVHTYNSDFAAVTHVWVNWFYTSSYIQDVMAQIHSLFSFISCRSYWNSMTGKKQYSRTYFQDHVLLGAVQ